MGINEQTSGPPDRPTDCVPPPLPAAPHRDGASALRTSSHPSVGLTDRPLSISYDAFPAVLAPGVIRPTADSLDGNGPPADREFAAGGWPWAGDEAFFSRTVLGRWLPAWFVSLTTHVLILVLLAILFVPGRAREELQLEAIFADELGEQLDDMIDISSLAVETVEDPVDVTVPVDMFVDDPLASQPVIEPIDRPIDAAADLSIPSLGNALNGRREGMKAVLLKAYGGNALTETAVRNGLAWLKRRQDSRGRDRGSWSLTGPYSKGGGTENRLAATGMALLAFQGAGHTTKQGDYQDDVAAGWRYLLGQQQDNGAFFKSGLLQTHRFYTHAIVTIALCELLAMTDDRSLIEPANRAIAYLTSTQGRQGGWRYMPGGESDVSVTGWVMMALQSARMAQLTVPTITLVEVEKFLDAAALDYGDAYAYMPGGAGQMAMTAEALLCRQYLGWKQNDPRMVSGCRRISDHPIRWRAPDLYYWYYGTQTLHHMGGPMWDEWNATLRKVIPKWQETAGPERGSWYHDDDRWTISGGRLYSTCLCLYMMEVYYRHLPLYNSLGP